MVKLLTITNIYKLLKITKLWVIHILTSNCRFIIITLQVGKQILFTYLMVRNYIN